MSVVILWRSGGLLMRNLCYLGSVAILILTFMVHLEIIGLDKGVIPFGFLLSIIFLVIGAIVAARAKHNIDFLFNKREWKRIRKLLAPRLLPRAFPFRPWQAQRWVRVFCCFGMLLHLSVRTCAVGIPFAGLRRNWIPFRPIPEGFFPTSLRMFGQALKLAF